MANKALLVGASALLTAMLSAAPANAASAPGTCPTPFVSVTLQQFVSLPQHLAGIADGVFDEAFLELLFTTVNNNGDDYVCVKPVGGPSENFKSLHFVNVVDNNAAPK